ncbi:uncharacterized protein LOC142220912 [Haematobia irritans]|uniref:uncharacterized protein LOC142220912 n=1 Tax=Haematobia irritans TaxID=7368 RepID=UPI003F4F4455
MNWFNIRFGLFVLLISCHSWLLVSCANFEEEQLTDSHETSRARSNYGSGHFDQVGKRSTTSNFMPSFSYDPFKSVSHNIGYNFGRNIGRTPLSAAPLDSEAEASKVVLVLANDKSDKSPKPALPMPNEETLKRMVRNPDFFQQFLGHMSTIRDQLQQQVPAMGRTMGEGFNEVLSQAPVLGAAQQASGLDYGRLGETFGQSILPERMFPGMGDILNGTIPSFDASATPAPATETETTSPPPQAPSASEMTQRVENELAPKANDNSGNSMPGLPFDSSMLLDHPLFRSFQQFVPPTLPPPSSEGGRNAPFNFNPGQYLSWFQPQTQAAAAASDISEVRVKPDTPPPSPYIIAPKEAISHRINEMKLRAAMRDALTKKTIPILWFRQADINGRDSLLAKGKSSSVTDEDMKMQMKLEAFERKLIVELQQLQDVVKLANALKKAQLEAKGGKAEADKSLKPLTLSSTPLYKITLADIENTLRDEYVQKLLQMASNAKKKDQLLRNKTPNGKYIGSDISGIPNKRQTATSSPINKDELMQMMAYAYRVAATNGPDMSWLQDTLTTQNTQDVSAAAQFTSPIQQTEQRQQTGEQQWMTDKQQQEMPKDNNERTPGDPYYHHFDQSHYGGFGGHPTSYGHPLNYGRPAAHFVHHHHIGRTDNTNMQTSDMMTSGGQPTPSMPMQQEQLRQGSSMTKDMPQVAQDQKMRQDSTQTITPEQQQIQSPMEKSIISNQRGWFEGSRSNGETQKMDQMNMAQQPNMAIPSDTTSMQQMRQQQQQWMPTMDGKSQLQSTSSVDTQQMRQNINSGGEQFEPMTNTGIFTNPSMDMIGQSQQQQQLQRQMINMADPLQMPMTNNGNAATSGQTSSIDTSNPTIQRQSNIQDVLKTDQTPITSNIDVERQMGLYDPAKPVGGEAKPQMPENAGKARHKGLEDFFDSLTGKDKKDKKDKVQPVINYYYNGGGSSYRPTYGHYSNPGYGYGYGGSSKPSSSHYYGGGAYGSNAYGSGGYYRTATGDAEIEEMLREHQTMPHFSLSAPDAVLALPTIASTTNNKNCLSPSSPNTTITDDAFQKMILLTRSDDNNRIRAPTSKSLDDTSTGNADLKNQTKRLASNDFANYKSFLIVVRPGKKSRKRSRRSAPYTTLEPIDESSLSELRKTYKNSLKEITLNPNETPEQALQRYNAESIREALEKANKTPMEISAGDDTAEIDDKGAHQDQYGAESGYMRASPKTHNDEQSQIHSPATSGPSAPLNTHHYNQFVSQQNSGVQMSAIHKPQVPISNAVQHSIPQTPYISVMNPYEPTVAVVDEYGGVNANAYHVSNANGLYTALNPGKPLTYTLPEISYGPGPVQQPLAVKLATIPNSMRGNLVRVYEPNKYAVRLGPSSAGRTQSRNSIDKSSRIEYSELEPPTQNKPIKTCDKSIENIYDILKKRLSDCCIACKEKLLKTLEDALKHSDVGHKEVSSPKKKSYDTKTTTQTIRKEDEETFKQWIDDMSQKGYEKTHLSKDLHRQYMSDGRFHLSLPENENSNEGMYESTQSFKRDTTIAESDTTDDAMTEEERFNEDNGEETMQESGSEPANNIKEKIANGEASSKSSKSNHILEPAESTTHSVYALRGKYKPNKRNAISKTQGKHFSNKYDGHHRRHSKKLGTNDRSKSLVNSISKTPEGNEQEKSQHIEEILDFIHELSKVSKERKTKSTGSTVADSENLMSSSTTTDKSVMSTPVSSSSKPKRRKIRISSVRPTKNAIAKDIPSTTSTIETSDSEKYNARTSNSSEKSSFIESLPSSTSPTISSVNTNSYEDENELSERERSLFGYHPQLLRPFMGLHGISHKDDPWHYKPFDLYRPIFTGGGTFESLLNRFRRNTSTNPAYHASANLPPTVPQSKHVLTPSMLERLLRIKMNFEKNYPFLYKTMMGHLTGDKHTSLSIIPPEIPEHVSYPNLELAAAEINQFEDLMEKIKTDQKPVLEKRYDTMGQKSLNEMGLYQLQSGREEKDKDEYGNYPGDRENNYSKDKENHDRYQREFGNRYSFPANYENQHDQQTKYQSQGHNHDYHNHQEADGHPNKYEYENDRKNNKQKIEDNRFETHRKNHYSSYPKKYEDHDRHSSYPKKYEDHAYYSSFQKQKQNQDHVLSFGQKNDDVINHQENNFNQNDMTDSLQFSWSQQSSQESYESTTQTYNSKQSFWDDMRDDDDEAEEEEENSDHQYQKPVNVTPSPEKSYWEQFQDSSLEEDNTAPRKRESFWSALEAAEEARQSKEFSHRITEDLDRIFNFDEDQD